MTDRPVYTRNGRAQNMSALGVTGLHVTMGVEQVQNEQVLLEKENSSRKYAGEGCMPREVWAKL